MYRCVSVTYKHKTFAKYIQEHLHPLLEVQKSPGCNSSTAQPQNRPGTTPDTAGWEAQPSTGSCGQQELGGARSIQTQLLVRMYSRF